ncbi:MAG: N-acetylneuraminate synthase family protein [Salaquimonas sp.]|nr:N-acetylneuraminate synthase family protein [Salaquimonas sp.]
MHKPNAEIEIAGRKIGLDHPTYFIADIAANHDGDFERAKELIYLAAEAGADVAKFQHFKAETIVSDQGFSSLPKEQMSHQAKWAKSVFEIYQDASIDPDWTPKLKEICDEAGITFFTTPYSTDLVDTVDPYVPAYKIGSGDITWPQAISYIAGKGKPTILAAGASTMDDVVRGVDACLAVNPDTILLQCNTNYTGDWENFRYVQLNVLKSFAAMYPGMILGLSDHTPGHAAVLGAVTLGGRVIEKHFTDDNDREGPDHKFALNPVAWRDMVDRTRELELALGDGIKKIEDNERDTVVIQRRGLRAAHDLDPGKPLGAGDIEALRPCPTDGIPPYMLEKLLGRELRRHLKRGDHFRWEDFE